MATTDFAALADTVRDTVALELPPAETASRVATGLPPFLSRTGLLTREQRRGDPSRYVQHLLHAERDGSFSIVALVWLPGQETPIHDHVSWCVTGVYEGMERERRYAVRRSDGRVYLTAVGELVNEQGSVCGFAPPGDIHRVTNTGAAKAISIHVYGANIARLGTSVRREYTLPVRDAQARRCGNPRSPAGFAGSAAEPQS